MYMDMINHWRRYSNPKLKKSQSVNLAARFITNYFEISYELGDEKKSLEIQMNV